MEAEKTADPSAVADVTPTGDKPADAPVVAEAKPDVVEAKPEVVAAKPAEAPAIKIDEARPRKTDAAPVTKPAPKATPRFAAAAAAHQAPKPAAKAAAAPKAFGSRALTAAESYGYYAAAALVVLGVGWIIGANTFDNRANERRVAEALRALDTKIEIVTTKIVTGGEVAAIKRNLDDMKQGLEGSRKTAAAISDLRSKFDASERTRAAAADAVVDRVAERMGNLGKEQGERLDKLAERLETIEKQLASQFPTASISAAPPTNTAATRLPEPPVQVPGVTMPMAAAPATPAAPAAPAKERDGHSTVERTRLPENGYVLREVYNGIAVVEGRRGLMEVGPGDTLPGAGRVRSIERRNRQWVVVTSNGVIDGNGY